MRKWEISNKEGTTKATATYENGILTATNENGYSTTSEISLDDLLDRVKTTSIRAKKENWDFREVSL